MSSLLKIQALRSTKSLSLNSFGHINSGDDFKKFLEEGQHEPAQSRETLARPLSKSKVPTAVEFKAIIHSSACPLDEILIKAPGLLQLEAQRLAKAMAKAKAEQEARNRGGVYTGDVKVPPSEYRQQICYGCHQKVRKEAEKLAAIAAKQEDAKEKFIRYLKARRAKREYGRFLDLTRDPDEGSSHLPSETPAPASGSPAVSRKPTWQFAGLNSKRSSAFGSLFRKDKISPDKRKMMCYLRAGIIEHDWTWNPHGHGDGENDKRKQLAKRNSDSDQVIIMQGVPVTIGGGSNISFTHWFGNVSMLTSGVKKTVFDLQGHENNEILFKVEDESGPGARLHIYTKRMHLSLAGGTVITRTGRVNHVGTFFVPRPDTLKQYLFVHSSAGHLIIQKGPPREGAQFTLAANSAARQRDLH